MPNWKKLITSGSAASLSSLQVTGDLTGSDNLYFTTTDTATISFEDTLNFYDRYNGTTGFYISQGDLYLKDSKTIYFGDGFDLRISHDSTTSLITNQTGDLKITNDALDKDIVLSSDNGAGGTIKYLTIDGSETEVHIHKNTALSGSISFKDDINLTYDTNGDNIGIGYNTQHTGSAYNSIAIGYNAKQNNIEGIAIGYSAEAGKRSVSIGYSNDAAGTGSVCIGYSADTGRTRTGAVAIGYGGLADAHYAHVYGSGTVTGRGSHLFGEGPSTSEEYKLIAGNLDLWASGSSRGNMYIMGSGSIGTSLDVGTDITVAGKVGAATNDEYFDFGTDAMIKVAIDNVEDFRFTDGGTFHANADIVAYSSTVSSDERLKTNIVDTEYGLDHILKLESKEFDWKEKLNGRHDIGFIAQQVQEVVPELVKEVDGLNGEDPHLTVDYAKVVPILVNAIKELKSEIEELKTK